MLHDRQEIIVVSGLPRSGTSMMMRMLVAGGLAALTDDRRQPDAHNPFGYFEYDPVRRIAEDDAWLGMAEGKAVKIVVPLLMRLPRDTPCKVILMRRDLLATAASQNRMIAAAGGDPGDVGDWMTRLAALDQEAQGWCAKLPAGRSLVVSFEDTLREPQGAAATVAAFLGSGLDVAAMAGAVARP